MPKGIAAALMICGLSMGAVGAAGPVAAAPAPEWLMPDVKGMVLANAIDEVLTVTGGAELNIVTDDTKGTREQINMTYWVVCWQSPKAGVAISQKSKYVGLGVKRLSDENCY